MLCDAPCISAKKSGSVSWLRVGRRLGTHIPGSRSECFPCSLARGAVSSLSAESVYADSSYCPHEATHGLFELCVQQQIGRHAPPSHCPVVAHLAAGLTCLWPSGQRAGSLGGHAQPMSAAQLGDRQHTHGHCPASHSQRGGAIGPSHPPHSARLRGRASHSSCSSPASAASHTPSSRGDPSLRS